MRSDFNISPLSKVEAKSFLYQIGNDEYYIRGVFINPNGDQVPLNKQSLKEIIIKDSIYEPFLDLKIVLIDSDNAFQRTKQGSGQNLIKGFNYRGDGKDIFYLEINPIKDATMKSSINGELNLEYNNVFSLRNIFACVDEKSIILNGESCKEITCIDYDKKQLLERKTQYNSTYALEDDTLPFSEAAYVAGGVAKPETSPIFYKDNSERAVPTGKSIRKILTSTLQKSEDELFYKSTVKEVVGQSGGFSTNERKLITNFEDGASKIFYTSDADSNAYDDIEYLYKYHVSDGNKQAFSYLKKDYYGGKYTFLSVDNIFKKAVRGGKAGPFMLEKLLVTGATSVSENTQTSSPVTPFQTASFNNKSVIADAKFFNPSFNLIKDKISTKIVHSYDHENKQFNIFKKDSNMTKAKGKFKEIFTNPINSEYSPSIISSPGLDGNENYENVYSLYGNDEVTARSLGVNKLLRNLMATNLACELTLFGQMFRKAGRFISVERGNNYKSNEFDDKFIGIYYILNVSHSFIGNNEYVNKIYAIKTYYNKDLQNIEGLK